MAEAFPVSGNIEPASFPHLLVDLHRHGATGSLKVTGPVHPKALYFRSGRILFGSSNDPRDQLGAILIESGRISREQLDEVNAKVGPGNPLAKVLAESGFVNQRELGDAARVKVERILADVLSWDSGTFEFEDGVLPKGAVDLKLSTERLLLAAVQRVPDRSFALRHVDLSTVLEPEPAGEAALSEVRAEVWPLLERLDGTRTLKDAIALTRLDEFEAAKTACAMLFLGVLRRRAGSGEELDLAQEAQSGFGAEPPPMYTVPVEAIRQAVQPPSEPTGFAFTEPEPAFPAVEPDFAAVQPETESPADTDRVPVRLRGARARARAVSPGSPRRADRDSRGPELHDGRSAAAQAHRHGARRPARLRAAAGAGRRARGPRAGRAVLSRDLPGTRPGVAPDPGGPRRARRAAQPLGLRTARQEPGGEAASREVGASVPSAHHPSAQGAGAPRGRVVVRSRVPLFIAAAIGGIVLATVAAWYFFLRTPAPPAPRPSPVATARATPVPPPTTLAAVASAAPTTPPVVVPTPAATATPVPTATPAPTPVTTPPPTPAPRPTPTPRSTATPPPTPAPRPTPTPRPTPAPVAPAGDARALLAQGALPDAARAFAASLRPGARGRFTLQVLVACAPENVQKAVSAVPAPELLVLPVDLKGRACYRLCWGVYDSRPAAEAALGSLPSYFRQGGAAPRLSPLAELLP